MIKEHNATTNEIIERQPTSYELTQMQNDASWAEQELAEAEAKEAARQALLDKLGITADEAKLLLG
jgi:hypothetical protein